MRMLGIPPTRPLLPIIVIEEPTYEGIVNSLLHGQPSIRLFSDEGGRLIGGYPMNEENRLKTAAGLNELWDGKRMTRVRANESVSLYGQRSSLHIMVQPEIADELIGDDLLNNVGLLSRCLIAFPQSTIGTRPYKSHDPYSSRRYERYENKIASISRTKPPLQSGTLNELHPPYLKIATELSCEQRIQSIAECGGVADTCRLIPACLPKQK